ncbi:hypothetical protein M10153_p4_05 (plasmid) [Escherichia coli]|nr:hypothetical protein M10153_p4_05 [Escherichia coli]
MSRTLEQKIAEAEARLQRLKAKSRSLDTAQKVIVGAALLAKVRKPEEVQLRAWLLQFLKAEVTRQADVTRILPLINELEFRSLQSIDAPIRSTSKGSQYSACGWFCWMKRARMAMFFGRMRTPYAKSFVQYGLCGNFSLKR